MMKKVTLIGSIAVAVIASMFVLMSFTSSPNTEEGVIVVRIVENYALSSSIMVIADGNKMVKTIKLAGLKLTQGNLDNALTISTELNELKKQGYGLVSSNGGANEGVLVTNYIFEKK